MTKSEDFQQQGWNSEPRHPPPELVCATCPSTETAEEEWDGQEPWAAGAAAGTGQGTSPQK